MMLGHGLNKERPQPLSEDMKVTKWVISSCSPSEEYQKTNMLKPQLSEQFDR